MSTKWLDVAFKRQKQDGRNGKTNATPVPMHPAPAESATADKVSSNSTGKLLTKPKASRRDGGCLPRGEKSCIREWNKASATWATC